MKKNLWIMAAAATGMLFLGSCGTTQKSTPTTNEPVTAPIVVETVAPEPEIISIAEAVEIFQTPDKAAEIAKKYGYKLTSNYEIYRLDKFSKLYYKNCRLAKKLTADKYEDYPKPLKKGISSYVAFRNNAIIIGVFNQKAYDNLVAQVKAAGFTLDMAGNEDIYVKGDRKIACYADGKMVRVQ
ncbi:hypothetical protein [Prevotella sp. HUN102]|uniref:hypothetical protein n=1 Tax=Prevotella sp. HUN102 TaxID=1392486 RepID=UPI0004916C2D|nr:hypothetical protein [Prevotella sp. HUN102]